MIDIYLTGWIIAMSIMFVKSASMSGGMNDENKKDLPLLSQGI